MKFSEIIGHEKIKETLIKMVDSGNLPHAFLLSGKSGIGKTRLARAMAQYIHCKNKVNGDSCGYCSSCLQHENLNNPDTHFSYPIVKKEGALISKDLFDQWKQMLSLDSYMRIETWNELIKAGNSQPSIMVPESEDIISRASLSSFQEKYKIFIIWLPEKLKIEAANKLLKIIEEPFEDTLFILVSNEPQNILPTILSRTAHISVPSLSSNYIENYLSEYHNIKTEIAEKLADLADGSLSKAEELALYPEEINEFADNFMKVMRTSYGLQGKKMKSLSESTAEFGREKLIRFLDYCSSMIRENFIYNLDIPSIRHLDEKEECFSKNFSPFVNSANVESLSQSFSKASSDIRRNANAKIVMFDLLFIISKLLRNQTKNF